MSVTTARSITRKSTGRPFTQVNAKVSTKDSNEILRPIVEELLSRLSPGGWFAAGEHIASCIRGDSFPDLCLYDPDVLDLDAHDQSIIRQCIAFFSKRVDIDLGIDRQAVAYEKFVDAEKSCSDVNRRFRRLMNGGNPFTPAAHGILHSASRKIYEVLEVISKKCGWSTPDGEGRAPTLAELRVRFGPGASSQVPKRSACPAGKLKLAPACSANFPFRDAAETLPSDWFSSAPVEIHDALLAFVEKNAKTKRAICTEPQLNSMFQLGLGEVLEAACLELGLDIHDQGPNQRAALYGSLSGYSATLDLTSASDTIALLLVRELFPSEWYDLILSLRSESAWYEGKRIYLEKVSSMGNGFTFPLETLIFWSISQSCVDIMPNPRKTRVLVYGDDIIIPATAFDFTCSTLMELGFTPNTKKSYAAGSFRESCGADYVFGTNVRPCFVTDALTALDVFKLHNWFFARGDFRVSNYLEGLVCPSIILRGPQGYGDGHLHATAWVSTRKGVKKGWSGFSFSTWASKPELLEEVVIRKMLDLPRGSKGDKLPKRLSGKNQVGKRAAKFAIRLATYATMVTHQHLDPLDGKTQPITTGTVDRLCCRSPQYFRAWLDRNDAKAERDAYASFVTPGAEWVARTKVYVFEPPYMRSVGNKPH